MHTIWELSAPADAGADVMCPHREQRTLEAPWLRDGDGRSRGKGTVDGDTRRRGAPGLVHGLLARQTCTRQLLPKSDLLGDTSAGSGILRIPGGFEKAGPWNLSLQEVERARVHARASGRDPTLPNSDWGHPHRHFCAGPVKRVASSSFDKLLFYAPQIQQVL